MYRALRVRRSAVRSAAAVLVIVAAGGAGPAAGQPQTRAASSLAGTWQLLPRAPIVPDSGVASVWTGRQVLVFGRVTTRDKTGAFLGRTNVAASYTPATDVWRRLPALGATSSFLDIAAVWTGREMLVWGQGTREAFNPRTSSWRKLPGSPLLAIHDGFGLVVWTGHELIGWGGGCCGDAFDDGVAYDPATNRWRALARSPLAGSQHPIGAWTGKELIVFVGGLDPDGKPWPARLARAAAYKPATNTWRRIAPLPAPRGGADAVWDGHEVLVVGGSGAAQAGKPAALATVGFAYSPTTRRWRRLPPMESGRAGAVAAWTGKRLLLWGGQTNPLGGTKVVVPPHGLAYDPVANSWSSLPIAPLLGRLDPTAVWTGRSLIVWGGEISECKPGANSCPVTAFHDGASFMPEAS